MNKKILQFIVPVLLLLAFSIVFLIYFNWQNNKNVNLYEINVLNDNETIKIDNARIAEKKRGSKLLFDVSKNDKTISKIELSVILYDENTNIFEDVITVDFSDSKGEVEVDLKKGIKNPSSLSAEFYIVGVSESKKFSNKDIHAE